MPGDWTPEPFEADDGTIPFQRFIDDPSDFKFVALDTAIDRVLSVRGIDLVRTEWLKALGEELHEFRAPRRGRGHPHVRRRGAGGGRPAGEGAAPGLLALPRTEGRPAARGYDKGDDPNERRQQHEIAEARRLLGELKERQRRERRKMGRGRG
jgi:hypothetical protein